MIDILSFEQELCDLVNAAYALTAEDVRLMWRTAPPRMPIDPAQELSRLDHRVRNAHAEAVGTPPQNDK